MAWEKDDSQLWAAYRKKPTPKNRNAIVEHHMPMAMKLSTKAMQRFHGMDYEFDDYLGWAVIGLIKAAENFDPSKGNKFCTYAWRCIESQILTGLNKANGCHYTNTEKREFLQSQKSVDYLGESLGVCDEHMFDVLDQAKAALKLVKGRGRRLIKAYYFGGKTLAEIATHEKLTRERVRQIIHRGMNTIRKGVGVLEEKPKRGRSRYPWETWANFEVWTVKQGVDFQSSPHAFQAAVRYHAKYHGLKVQTWWCSSSTKIGRKPESIPG